MTSTAKRALIFVLDRSGSMKDIKANTIEGYNGYLAKMKEVEGLEYTLVQFDTVGTDTVHRRIPIGQVSDLTPETFEPRAGTPLVDAACITLDIAIDKYQPTDKVIFTILTDGHENASRDYKMADLHDRIKKVTGWGWEVVFLGASIDAYKDAGAAGVLMASTMSYNAKNRVQNSAAMSAAARATTSYFAGAGAAILDTEREAAGDQFWKQQANKPGEGTGGDKSKTLIDKANL